jgi:hypothetical protein
LVQEKNPEERLTQLQHNVIYRLQELLLVFGWKENVESSCLIHPVCHVSAKEELEHNLSIHERASS